MKTIKGIDERISEGMNEWTWAGGADVYTYWQKLLHVYKTNC